MFKLNLDKLRISKIKLDNNLVLLFLAVLGVFITLTLIIDNSSLSTQKIAKKSVNYLNKNILQEGQKADLVDFSKESGVIKIKIKIGDNDYDSYVTKDGKLFFPEVLKINPKEDKAVDQNKNSQASDSKAKQTCENIAKSDSPILEAYIVSKCPFGLQMQRAMADAIKNIPSLEKSIKVRYIGNIYEGKITAMHGDAEAQENLRQICLREEQSNKYWKYISCHIGAGDVDGCLNSVGVNINKLGECMTNKNKGIAYAKDDFDLSSKYGISGSPTLMLNGQLVSEFDFGGRSSDAIKNILSCAFKKKPDFSSTQLNTYQAAPSFSLTYASSAGNSQPGSGNNNPSCAPI